MPMCRFIYDLYLNANWGSDLVAPMISFLNMLMVNGIASPVLLI